MYGKRASFWKVTSETAALKQVYFSVCNVSIFLSAVILQGKNAYLDVIHNYLDVHGTVDDGTLLPSYVKNHGIVKGTEVQTLLRQSKVSRGHKLFVWLNR